MANKIQTLEKLQHYSIIKKLQTRYPFVKKKRKSLILHVIFPFEQNLNLLHFLYFKQMFVCIIIIWANMINRMLLNVVIFCSIVCHPLNFVRYYRKDTNPTGDDISKLYLCTRYFTNNVAYNDFANNVVVGAQFICNN